MSEITISGYKNIVFSYQTETALMYDAALLFAHALSELDRSQVKE